MTASGISANHRQSERLRWEYPRTTTDRAVQPSASWRFAGTCIPVYLYFSIPVKRRAAVRVLQFTG
eukprot:6274642-Pyramimonas_sp.AAC.1